LSREVRRIAMSFVPVAPSVAPSKVRLALGVYAPLLSPIGLTAAGLFAGGEVSRADSCVR